MTNAITKNNQPTIESKQNKQKNKSNQPTIKSKQNKQTKTNGIKISEQ